MKKKQPVTFWIGVGLLLLFAAAALFAPWISPYDPDKIGVAFQPPSAAHLLGTNDVGQDILSELIYGTRISLSVGLVAALVVTGIGTAVGLLAGYFGGNVDRFCSFFMDAALSLPSLPLAFVLSAYLHSGFISMILVICLTSWAGTARIVRAKVLQLRSMPFVLAARAMGCSPVHILTVHILPNLYDLVVMRGILSVSSAMLMEASLSFLGIGLATEKSWGKILYFALKRNGVLNGYWWWYLPPIFCISLCVLGFMLVGYRGKPGESVEGKGEAV